MKHIHADMDATYGKVKIHSELQSLGVDVGLHQVTTAMKRLGIVAKRPKQQKYLFSDKLSVITTQLSKSPI